MFYFEEKIAMRIAVQADDGDEVSISADFLSVEQATVTLEVENRLYSEVSEFDSVTLSIDKARELANALLVVAESIESMLHPITLSRQPQFVTDAHANFASAKS